MMVKRWTIISREEAEAILRYLHPVDITDLEERERVHAMRRRLMEELGKMEKREILWQARKRMEGAE